jgi:cytidylate kinase
MDHVPIDHLAAALAGAATYTSPQIEAQKKTGYTIALSREEGVPVHQLAHELGQTLGWQVYDHELIQLIAKEMGVDVRLLERIDERNVAWLEEAFNSLMEIPAVSAGGFVTALRKTVDRLARMGHCIIVGRGAPHVLPVETTLRVRLIANRRDRIVAVARCKHISHEAAARHIDEVEEQRDRFIRTHFFIDPRDPQNYDLVLNVSHLTIAASVDLLAAALRSYQASRNPLQPA